VTRRGFRILNTEPGRFSEEAREALRRVGDVDEIEADRAHLLGHVSDYHALFICLRNVIDRDVIERGAQLRYIATPTTGTDHIDIEAARARGIAVLSLAGETELLREVTATAELTWGLLLALIRKLPQAHSSVMSGEWARDSFRGTELRGKTLGVIGYGRLGRMVAEYGSAFRMKVLAFDRNPERELDKVEFVALDQLLQRSDVVSVHLPLSRETEGFFDVKRFEAMKACAVLINTSRGRIVDESALLEALRSGKLAGAAVDVLASETSNRSDWLGADAMRDYARAHDNLLITPHIGGMTQESVEMTNLFMVEKLARHLRQPTEECAR
jgi:D-3-phosphoglycerate dehydrogenase